MSFRIEFRNKDEGLIGYLNGNATEGLVELTDEKEGTKIFPEYSEAMSWRKHFLNIPGIIVEVVEHLEFMKLSEFRKLMTPEQKAKAAADFHKFYTIPFGDSEPIMCGPEARAKANGTLDEYYAEGEDYLRKVDLDSFDIGPCEGHGDELAERMAAGETYEEIMEDVNSAMTEAHNDFRKE